MPVRKSATTPARLRAGTAATPRKTSTAGASRTRSTTTGKAPAHRGRKTEDAKALAKVKDTLASTKAVPQNKLAYTFRVFGRAPVIYSGQLVSMDEHTLEIRGHRSGSSKIDRHMILAKDVISVLGGVGENSVVRVMDDNAKIAEFTGRVKRGKSAYHIETVEGVVTIPYGNFNVKAISEEPGTGSKRGRSTT